jgi:predicted nucleotidyltransferase
MRTSAPPLLPIFRSRLQGELLAATLLEPGREESLTGLADRLGADVGTVQREVSRLERAGILRTRRVGHTRLAAANPDSPIYAPLAELVLRAFGPLQVVAEEFAGIEGVDEILLFGSWAARYLGEEGLEPADLDVLVIGRPSRDALYEAALRAERRLGRQVNLTVRSKASWQSAGDGFVKEVRRSPLVSVAGTKFEETAHR